MGSRAKGGPAGAAAAAHADITGAQNIASFAEAMEDRPIRNEKDKKSRADRTSLACKRLGHLLLSANKGEAKDVEFWWPILIVEVKALVGGSFAGHNLGEIFSGMSDSLSATGVNLYDSDEELKHAVEKRIISTCGKLTFGDIAEIAGFFKSSDKPPLLDLFPALDKKLSASTIDGAASDSSQCSDRNMALANFKACCARHKYVKTAYLPGGARQAAPYQKGLAVGHEEILLQQQEAKKLQRQHVQRQQEQIQQFQLLLQQKKDDELEWEKKHQELEAEIAAQRAREKEEREVADAIAQVAAMEAAEAEAVAQVAALEAAEAVDAGNSHYHVPDWESRPHQQHSYDQLDLKYDQASYPKVEVGQYQMSKPWDVHHQHQHQHQQRQQQHQHLQQQGAYGQLDRGQQMMYPPGGHYQMSQPWNGHQRQHSYGGSQDWGYGGQGFGHQLDPVQDPSWGPANQVTQQWREPRQEQEQEWGAAGGGLPGPVVDPNADIAGAASIDEFMEVIKVWPVDPYGDKQVMNRLQSDRTALAVARFGYLLNSSAVKGRGNHFGIWAMLLGNVKDLLEYFSAANLGQFFSGILDNFLATGVDLYEADETLRHAVEKRIMSVYSQLMFGDIAPIAGLLNAASTYPHWELFPVLEGRLHNLCSNPLNIFSTSPERNLAIANFRSCCQRHKYVISAATEKVLGLEPAAGDRCNMAQEQFHDQEQQHRLLKVEGVAAAEMAEAQQKADEKRVIADTIAGDDCAAAARMTAEEAQRQEQLEQERQAREQDEGEQDDDAMIDDLSKLLLG